MNKMLRERTGIKEREIVVNVVPGGNNNSIIEWLSLVCNIIMLVFVVFGYFYTVVPVYERDVLVEQKSILEMDISKLTDLNNKISGDLARKEESLFEIKKQIKEKEVAISQAKKELERVSYEYSTVMKRNVELNKDNLLLGDNVKMLVEQQKYYVDYIRDYVKYFYDFSIDTLKRNEWVFRDLSFSYDQNSFRLSFPSEVEMLEKIESFSIPDIKLKAVSALQFINDYENGLPEAVRPFFSQLKKQYKMGFDENVSLLSCQSIDKEAWKKNYREILARKDELYSICGSNQDSFVCSVSYSFAFRQFFETKLHSIGSVCLKKLDRLNSFILGDNENIFEGEIDTNPPSFEDVELKMKKDWSRWSN